MNDLALQLVTQEILSAKPLDQTQDSSVNEENLWLLDENLSPTDVLRTISACKIPLDLICNRFDLQQSLTTKKNTAVFSDFDFDRYQDNSISRIFYRISKEKTVVHHIINQACRVLKPGGAFIITGYKNEGAKTYIDKASKYFNGSTTKSKGGSSSHIAIITKGNNQEPKKILDDKNYSDTQSIRSDGLEFISKPGQFGWNKVDKGSEFLIEQLPKILDKRHQPVESILDLGCGYGFLSIMAYVACSAICKLP